MKTSAMLKGTTTKAFLIPGTTNPAIFIFDGEDGGIWGWNPGVDLLNATLIVQPASSDPTTNSVYKGLTSASRTPWWANPIRH